MTITPCTRKQSPAAGEVEDEAFAPSAPGGKRRCSSPPSSEDGQTKLHKLCQDPRTTVEQVRSYLEEFPEATRMADVYGRTPVFYALKRALSLEVIDLLLSVEITDFDELQSVTKTDFCGESGLYLLFHPSKCPSLLKTILHKQPTLSMHRSNSFSDRKLLDRICDPWSNDNNVRPSSVGGLWDKLVLTVKAAHRVMHQGQQGEDEELHIALELGLSPNLLCHFVEQYPHQARKSMTRQGGCLPLHYVVRHENLAAAKGGGSLIRQLLLVFSQAASIPFEGHYPLHSALLLGCKWSGGIQELAFACHNALHTRDETSGLCPFQMAALAPDNDLTTIFSLLRERPCIHSASK